MGTHRYAVHPIDVFSTEIKQIWANESPFPIDFVHRFKDTLSPDLIGLPLVRPPDQLSLSCSAPRHLGQAVNDL